LNNVFVVGLENNVLKKTFERLAKKKIIRIISTITTNKYASKKTIQFIESSLYDLDYLAQNFQNNNPLNPHIVKNFQNTEINFYKMMDRIAIKFESIREISILYNRLLECFINFFQNHNINTIIYEATPHFPVQLMIFDICKYLKIKTIIIQRTDIDNYYILKHDLFPKKMIPTNQVDNNSHEIENYFNIHNKSYWNKRSTLLNNQSLKLHSDKMVFNLYIFIKIFLKVIYQEFFYVLNNESIFYYKKLSIFKRIYYKHSYILKFQKINNYVNKLSVLPDLKIKYIYFALHFQPERSTLPEGGIFVDQFLCLQILSNSISKDTKIYVKEHPRQIDLFPDLRRYNSRDLNFYKEISKLENVQFVKTDFNSDLLLKNAFINATVTGSLGSDSIKYKIPTIIFSHTWYSSCGICKVVGSVAECSEAIKFLSKLSPSKINNQINAFKKNVQKFLFKTNLNNSNIILKQNELYSNLKKNLKN